MDQVLRPTKPDVVVSESGRPTEFDVVEFAGPRRLRRSTRTVSPGAPTLSVEAVGVCGTDRQIFHGVLPVPEGTVLGHEVIGVIGHLPDPEVLVAEWQPESGDRVVLAPGVSCLRCRSCLRYGMYCERRRLYGLGTDGPGPHGGMSRTIELFPGTRVFRVPDDLDIRRAIFIEPLACAVRAVATALPVTGALIGRRVVVVGFGPMGLAVATVARMHGAQVAILDPDPTRCEFAATLGFTVVEPGSGADRAVDLAVECAGTPAAFDRAVGLVRPGGTVVEMGNFGDTGAGGVAPSDICLRDLRVLGTSVTRDEDFFTAIDVAVRSPVDLAAAVNRIWSWDELLRPDDLFDIQKTAPAFKQMIVMEG